MQKFVAILFPALLLTTATVGSPAVASSAEPPQLTAMPHSPLAAALNHFSVSLFRRLCESTAGNNVFASPLSVSTALSMLLMGANTTTKDQLANALRLDHVHDSHDIHSLFKEVSCLSRNTNVLFNFLLNSLTS